MFLSKMSVFSTGDRSAPFSVPRKTMRGRVAGAMLSCAALAGSLTACQTTSTGVNPQLAANDVSVTAVGDAGEDVVVGRSSFGNYLAGRHAIARQDPKAAAAYLDLTLDRDPENLLLISQAFVVNLGIGDIDEAAILAEKMLAQGQENATARIVLASRALKNEKPEDASTQIGKVQDISLFAILNPMARAWIVWEKTKDSKLALKELEPLKGPRGIDTLYQMHAALILDMAGKKDEAEKHYAIAHGEEMDTSLRFTQLIGNFYERAGKADQARKLYSSYRENDPESVHFEAAMNRLNSGTVPAPMIGTSSQGMAEALFDIASVLQQERAPDLALIYARISLYLRRDLTLARMVVGNLLESQERFEESIAAYKAVPPDSPFHWTAQLRIADNLEFMGQTDGAIERLEVLAGERPKRWDALARIGNLLHSHERYEEAADAYDRAIERIGTLEERHWSILYARGRSLERAREWDRAEKDFLQALELEPEQPYVLNYLGYSWIELGMHLERARKMIERAVEQRPNDGYIVDSLGWVLFKLGEYEGAVTHLEHAVELRPQDSVINDHLGDAYWKVGRRNEARFQWKRALSMDPEDDQVEVIEEKIDRGLPDNVASE